MLAAVKKGRSVNEAEIPPPVATGAPSVAPAPSVATQPSPPEPSPPSNSSESTPVDQPAQSLPEIVTPSSEEEQPSSSSLPAPRPVPTPEETTEEPGEQPQTVNEETKTMLAERQREYKMAALRAKKQGDLERARLYLKISKVCSKRWGFGFFCFLFVETCSRCVFAGVSPSFPFRSRFLVLKTQLHAVRGNYFGMYC